MREVLSPDRVEHFSAAFIGNFAVGKVVAAANNRVAANTDEIHSFAFAGLETNGRSSGNIQAHAVGFAAIKTQRRVRFDEMIMAADLNRTIAKVGDGKRR